MFVKPAEGRKVLRPDTLAHLPAEGAEVPDSTFWHRRLRSGEVELAEPPTAEAAPAEAVAALGGEAR